MVDPKAGGGLFALDAATGKKVWSAPPPRVRRAAAIAAPRNRPPSRAIPGVVFSGSVDGHLRAYSTTRRKGRLGFRHRARIPDRKRDTAKGGSMDGPGPAMAAGCYT